MEIVRNGNCNDIIFWLKLPHPNAEAKKSPSPTLKRCTASKGKSSWAGDIVLVSVKDGGFGGNEVYFLHVHPILSPKPFCNKQVSEKQNDLPIFVPFRLFHFFQA